MKISYAGQLGAFRDEIREKRIGGQGHQRPVVKSNMDEIQAPTCMHIFINKIFMENIYKTQEKKN